MPQQTAEKLQKDVKTLREEMREIKHFLYKPLKDPEGAYTVAFVKKMLGRAEHRGPLHRFASKESFLRHVASGGI